MKNRYLHTWLFAASALIAGLSGCSKDPGIEPPAPGPDPAGDEVTITVTIPASQAPSTRSIAGGGESVVESIDLLVFEKGAAAGNPDVLSQHVEGTILSQSTSKDDAYEVQFKGRLDANPDATTLVILANTPASTITAVSAMTGSPKQAVMTALTCASQNSGGHPEDWKWHTNPSNTPSPKPGTDYSPIPMYGEKAVTGITKGMKIKDVGLARMLARIDVVNKAPGFTLEGIYVVNYNTAGYIAPAWNPSDGKLLVPGDATYPYTRNLDPTLPANSGKQVDPGDRSASMYYGYEDNGGEGITGDIYVYEALKTTAAEGTAGHTQAMCLILKGTMQGDPQEYFYRVDFTAGTDAAGKAPGESGFDPLTVEYMPVYRNHRYTFTIGSIAGIGYTDFSDALRSLGIRSNLRTSLMVLDESTIRNTVFNGEHYLGTGDPLELDFLAGQTAEVLCVTNYAYGWQIDTDQGTGGIEYISGADWLSAVKDGAAADQKATIKLETLTANETTTPGSAYVHLKAGTLRHKLKVAQTGGIVSFEVTGTGNYTYAGGSRDFIVQSEVMKYYADGTSTLLPVPWIAEYTNDDGETWGPTVPDWVRKFPTEGPGGPATPYPIEMKAYPLSTSNPEDLLLRSAAVKGTAYEPYDLSTQGGTQPMTTANCYIINAAGHYKLPLVYGNAIKNGADNRSAYRPTGTASATFLKNFVDHDNQPILTPYIYKQASPADATVVWMDSPDLVTEVTLTDGGDLSFFVDPAYLGQGNAIVAVRDSDGTILWSWHIWVTPLVNAASPATDEVKNHQGVMYNFMQYNLGWCTGKISTFTHTPGDNTVVRARITPQGLPGTAPKIFGFLRLSGDVTTGSNAPYWQWGRKDPMSPSQGMGYGDSGKPLYGTYSFSIDKSGQSTLGNAIMNPNVFYKANVGLGNYANWCSSGNFNNLWNAENTVLGANDNAVIKTVYDPGPPGFNMPTSNAWTGFTTTANSVSVENQINKDGPWASGWTFYNYSQHNNPDYASKGKSFYPALGTLHIVPDKNWVAMDEEGYNWSASPYNAIDGSLMYFGSPSMAQPYNQGTRSYGMCVRPIKE